MTSLLSVLSTFHSSHDPLQLKNGPLVVAPFFIALCVFYHLLAPRYPSSKQRSWIVTTISSSVMTLCSLPFVWDYLSSGSVRDVRTSSTLALAANRFFQAHLLADSAMGALYYRDQVAFLTGWVHHIVYVLIVEMAIRRSWAQVFCLCASMELPTFILASTILHPRFRSNLLFAVAFFITRIMLHIVLCISYLLPHNREATGGSVIPGTILIFVFPLHAFWFYGCLKGFVKRARKAKAEAAATRSTSPSVVLPLAMAPEKCTDVQATQREAEIAQPPPPIRRSLSQSLNEWRHSSMTMPGSFSFPPLRLRLSVQRLSPKHRKRNVRDPLDAPATLRTPSSERV